MPLSITVLSVVMLIVGFFYCYAECRYVECHYAECRCAFILYHNVLFMVMIANRARLSLKIYIKFIILK